MLNNNPVFPSIRVTDMKAAREFYEGKLGLKVIYVKPSELLLKAGKNSRIYLYEGDRSVAENTVAVFYVDDIYKKIDQLSKKGVEFEHYDSPGVETDEKGVSGKGKKKGAWFKDPDGHILALSQIK